MVDQATAANPNTTEKDKSGEGDAEGGPNQAFARDVISGLSQNQKYLSSKYFYDEAGSELFDKITEQPEYYLTRAEAKIINDHGSAFFNLLGTSAFNLIELGCGNGDKTFSLLTTMRNAGQHFRFYPVDISRSAIDGLIERLHKLFPLLSVEGQQADYHELLPRLKKLGAHKRNVVLFLGSNIGNYPDEHATKLLGDIHKGLNSGDLFLMGMDLKKDYQRMTAAYNDKNGVTEAFNLNLLQRMNKELGANFDLEGFSHYEIYNPLESAMQSFLVSAKKQSIGFSKIDFSTSFDAHEALFVESSRKYSFADIEKLAQENGFKVLENFTDENLDFVDSLWERE
jgi:dimethylhistidine N-methyltransferase